MPRVIFAPERGQRVPVHVWARSVDTSAVRQLQRLAAQPYVVDRVAAMPDVHLSEGVSVGTVFATEGTVVPGALGGDLGCGMSALRFDLVAASLDRRRLEALLDALDRAIPVGDATHRDPGVPLPSSLATTPLSTRALEHTRDLLGPRHLGTLGGGNHFLEIDRDGGGSLWLVVHSGSRGLGGAIAAHHARAAGLTDHDRLVGLGIDTDAGAAYLADLTWALAFARANREVLLTRAIDVVTNLTGASPDLPSRVDVHHNFAAREEHQGRMLIVHRKGATSARAGERGIIPGSMGTASYVVEGLGNPASFCSCSHGAGRVMSRREARERITPAALDHAMRRVVFDRRRMRPLVEEAPAAYRDIREVLEDQADLVAPRVRLEPIAVLKG